jgi:2'-5' RNA ligase
VSVPDLHVALTRSRQRSRSRADGLTSVYESVATGQSVGGHLARYTSSPTLGPAEIDGLLAHDWRARREITQLAGDLVREGVEICDLPEWVDTKALDSWIEGDSTKPDEIGLLAALRSLWAEGESYGGAVLIAVLDDGLHPSEPVDLTRIRRVRSWQVLDRHCVWPYREGGLTGPISYWLISSTYGALDGLDSTYQIVHPSRVVAHTGLWMPGRWRAHQNGWGLSRLELLRDQRETLALGSSHLGRLLQRSSQDVVTFSELSELTEEAGDAYVAGKIAQMRLGLHSLGLVVLDGGTGGKGEQEPGRPSDSFTVASRPLGGASDIAVQQHEDWRRGSAMPRLVADGEVAGGLNSGEGAGEWRSWGGTVAAEQKASLTRPLNWALGLIFASSEGPSGGRVPESWTVEWTPIAEPDHELEARVAEAEARVDAIYQSLSVLGESEIRQWRAVEGKGGRVRVEDLEAHLPGPDPEGEDDRLEVADRQDRGPDAGVFVTLPPNLAKLFPYKPEDTSPPHCTVLQIGPTGWDQVTTIRETVARLSVGLLPIKARLGDLGYFEKADGSRVAWVAVEFDPALDSFHLGLRDSLMAAGVMVDHRPGPWVAHATLAYLNAGEDYSGPIPAGEWVVSRLEVWHGDDR